MKHLLSALLFLLLALHAVAFEFQPGIPWPDSDGIHINTHGGGMLFHEGSYYYKIEDDAGNPAQVGVSMYSSKDLHHWKTRASCCLLRKNRAATSSKAAMVRSPRHS